MAVQPTRTAKRRQKLQAKWGQQMSLFDSGGETPLKPKDNPQKGQLQPKATAPSAIKGRRARKGGEFVAGKRYEGGQWIPKAAFEAQSKGQPYKPESKAKQPAQKLQVIDDGPVTVKPAESRSKGYTIPPEPKPSEPTESAVADEPKGSDTWQETLDRKNQLKDEFRRVSDEALAARVRASRQRTEAKAESTTVDEPVHEQQLRELRDRLSGLVDQLDVKPKGLTQRAVDNALDRLAQEVPASDGAKQMLGKYHALATPSHAAHQLVQDHKLIQRMDRDKQRVQSLSREATAIAPKKEQVHGRSEQAIADFLTKAGLSGKVFADKEFHRSIKNPPYEDLAIERQGDRVMFTHYYEQNGDLVPDGEMAFDIAPNGQLKLAYTAAHLYGRESRGLDKKYAAMWSRNLVAQGFHEAAQGMITVDEDSPEVAPNSPEVPSSLSLDDHVAAAINDTYPQLDLAEGTALGESLMQAVISSKGNPRRLYDAAVAAIAPNYGGETGSSDLHEEVQRFVDNTLRYFSDPENKVPQQLSELVDPTPAEIHDQMEQRRVEPSVMADVDYAYQGGQKRRLRTNQQVKALLAQDKTEYTPDELTLLAQYSGKGGITGDEGSLSEYYTRDDVAGFVTGLLDQFGFKQGTVLEPSCGNGVFLHQFKGRDEVLPVGVEMDETSSAAAAALNPHAEVAQSTRFERFLLDNPEFQADAIVGNVPFGTRTVSGDMEASRYKLKQWKDNGDLFVAESLERLKPRGVMALVVPSGIISGKSHQKLRDHLSKHGRMLGAYRLPNDAFKHSGTSVVTDVLIMQRHPDEVLTAIQKGDEAAISATADHGFVGGAYFDDNSEHVLGEAKMVNRGFRETLTVEGDTSTAIQNAPVLNPPAVDYEGLNLQPSAEAGAKLGDEKYINGRRYVLSGNPPRWHLVQDAEVEAQEAAIAEKQGDPTAFGVDSMAEAEAVLRDPGLRVRIHPDHLGAYIELSREIPPRKEWAAMRDAKIAIDRAGNGVNAEKLAHAMLLAGHLKLLQDGAPSDQELEQALNMLQGYREKYGNPAGDRDLTQMALDNTVLLRLQGAFNDDDSISDYFANPDAVKATARRSHSDAGSAMREAFRSSGGEPVTLDEVKGALSKTMGDRDLKAALSADPTVGYLDGQYQPFEKLMVGNGYDLMDTILGELETLPEGSPLHRKLSEQVAYIRTKLEPRPIEDMTTPFWAVGSWIPAAAMNAFLASQNIKLEVALNPATGDWYKTNQGYTSDTASDVLAQMNRERISHGSKTQEAKAAIAALEEEFRDFLAGSDWRLDVEQSYNLVFNGDLPPADNDEPIDIPLVQQWDEDPATGRKKKRLHGYQASTIRQMIDQGRGIISLGVGLGKTATSIAMALQLKAMGRAKKPSFVVPKSVLANWVREIDFWAPDANVMVVGMTQQFWGDGSPAWEVPGHKIKLKGGNPVKDAEGNYLLTDNETGETVSLSEKEVQKRGNLHFREDSAAVKERKLQQLSQNSYDIVLMSEPVFQQVGLDPETEHSYLEDVSAKGRNISPDTQRTHKMLAQLEAAKRKLAERTGDKTKNITFEDLGIDCLIHDEAHHLKNLFGTQRTGDVAFMSQAESNRALDFYYKSRYIREQNSNQNVYLLTATPTTNNPLEAYNMLQHVCPDEFEKRGIQNVDDFLGMFGQIESITVPGVDLEMTQKNGLTGFKNLKDLRKMFGKYCRLQSAKDVGLPIPEEAVQDHYVDMSPAQAAVYADLKERAKELTGGDGEETDDHIFSVISDMDKAAIDIEYFNDSHSDYATPAELETNEDRRSPKIEAAAKQVMASLKANEGKQIVFCDAVQMHGRLKAALVKAGYPEDEIQIVNAQTAKRSSDRQKISQQYNDGKITLVIGNTATMGEGMNFQVGTTDIHHLTTPWTPAAIEQRNGRGVRQGNALDEVGVHYYHANKSFDGYRKGVVERKRGWIDELWKGGEDTMTNQNTGAINMDEIAVMMADDPEAARQQLAQNKELQAHRFKEKQTKGALRQFGQLQTMRLAYSKIKPESKAEARAVQLADRIKRTADSLGRNEFFPYKPLLDGQKAAYVGSDGTVLTEGHHIKENDGSVWRVTSINSAGNKIQAQQVSGTDDRPFEFSEQGFGEFDFKDVNSRSKYSRIEPVEFNAGAHEKRVVGSVSNYGVLKKLSPETINANRDRLTQQIKDGYGADYIPYRDADGKLQVTTKAKDLGDGDQLLFPHDGETIEALAREVANPDSHLESWKTKYALGAITSPHYGYSIPSEIQAKINGYKAQFAAMREAGPRVGDTRTNEAGHQEVFRDGRWRLASQPGPEVDTAEIAGSLGLDPNTAANVRRRVDEVVRSGKVTEPEIRRMVDNATPHLSGDRKAEIADTFVTQLKQKGLGVTGQTYHDPEDKEALRDLISGLIPDGASLGTRAKNQLVRGIQEEMNSKGGTTLGMKERIVGVLGSAARLHYMRPMANEVQSSFADAIIAQLSPPPAQAADGSSGQSEAWKALANEVGGDLATQVEQAILDTRKEGWVGNTMKGREVKRAIAEAMPRATMRRVDKVYELATRHYGKSDGGAAGESSPVAQFSADAVVTDSDGTEEHPDPIGDIHDALKRIEESDTTEGSLKNIQGWGITTREFGSSLAQQVAEGGELSANQLDSALSMLTTKHSRQAGNLPTREQLREAIALRGDDTQAKPPGSVEAEIKQTVHAKHGHDLHVVTFDRVPKDVYSAMNIKAKELGGYYSRYTKQGAIPGFQFKDPEAAAKMLDYVSTLRKSAQRYRLGDEVYVLQKSGSGKISLVRDRPWNVRLAHV
ncbi:MAG: SNF2-related protein [Cyanobacteria bacterium]|nr:SNF2-related protein [Cyanobacteriota bacterium]